MNSQGYSKIITIANQNAQKLLLTSLVNIKLYYFLLHKRVALRQIIYYTIQITIIYNKFYLRGARDVAKDELSMFCFISQACFFFTQLHVLQNHPMSFIK